MTHTGAEYDDKGGASRFFYCAKTHQSERDAGVPETFGTAKQDPTRVEGRPGSDNPRNRGARARANAHPTVKPIAVMRWLVRLVTPPGGLVLDPFTGSGSTGCAAVLERMRFHGFELPDSPDVDPVRYGELARHRIAHWAQQDPATAPGGKVAP